MKFIYNPDKGSYINADRIVAVKAHPEGGTEVWIEAAKSTLRLPQEVDEVLEELADTPKPVEAVAEAPKPAARATKKDD